MKERDINAYFENDAIYVTNKQDDEMDMIEDIIHEISHAIEQYNQEFIYGTGALQREFIAKRKTCPRCSRKSLMFPLVLILILSMIEPLTIFFFGTLDMTYLIRYVLISFLLAMLLHQ